MKRTFIAIKIPVLKNMENIVNELKLTLNDEKIKWVESWNIHITLFFIGDTEEDMIVEIGEALKYKLKEFKKFSLECFGLGVFKSIYNPKAFWLGLKESELLQDLKKSVDDIMRSFGYSVDERKFKPHITIGRTKFLKDKNQLKQLINKYENAFIQDIEVNEVVFYESELTAKGPIYKVLKSIPLN